MKYTIVFTQEINHAVLIDANSRDEAEDIADDLIDNGEVEFDDDDIISACGAIQAQICVAEYSLRELWEARADTLSLMNQETRAFFRALDETEDWATNHGTPEAATWDECEQFIEYAMNECLRFNSCGMIV